MIIVDTDVHFSPFVDAANTKNVLQKLDTGKIDKALAWLLPPELQFVEEGNRYVYSAVKEHPDRLIGFGWISPKMGEKRAKEEIKRCVEEYGFHGIKFNGSAGRFVIDSPAVMNLLEEIVRHKKILAFHTGADAPIATNPLRVANIAKRFPETPVISVHFGGVYQHQNLNLGPIMIQLAKECPNIIFAGSEQSQDCLLDAVRELSTERLMFASDLPFCDPKFERVKYEMAFEGEVSQDNYAKIMGGNMLRLIEENSKR